MMNWDSTQREFIFDHGWNINRESGKLELTKKQFKDWCYTGKLNKEPGVKTIMLPSVHGCCLILEHKHFEIV